ncbi:MAG TPA: 2TM domain-containing protein [Chloroflexia bacterium]|nr:2TM domain-containing protein [Chloroflexia bacterium]
MYSYEINQQEAYREAQRIVRAKLRFYRSLTSYVIVNAVLLVIWFLSVNNSLDLDGLVRVHSWNYPWFLWVMIPWGIGLLFQFMNAFVYPRRNSRSMLEAEMRKMGVNPQPPVYYYPAPNSEEIKK